MDFCDLSINYPTDSDNSVDMLLNSFSGFDSISTDSSDVSDGLELRNPSDFIFGNYPTASNACDLISGLNEDTWRFILFSPSISIPYLNNDVITLSADSCCHSLDNTLNEDKNQQVQFDGSPEVLELQYPLDQSVHDETSGESFEGSFDRTNASQVCDSCVSLSSISTQKKKRRSGHSWTKKEDIMLNSIVNNMLNECSHIKWPRVAKEMNMGLKAKQCREHYQRRICGNNKNAWTEEENQLLNDYLNGMISSEQLLLKVNRTNKQIRERISVINKTSGSWTTEEILLLRPLVEEYGDRYGVINSKFEETGYHRSYQQVRSQVNAILKEDKLARA